MNLFFRISAILFLICLIAGSCRKSDFITDPSAKLTFSTDTVWFDTIFTGIGSATRYLMVKNLNKLPINISEIKLAKGINSKFRLNINGTSGNNQKDIVINANDSIFIFADVTIDPEIGDIIEYDQIRFKINGKYQIVHLSAIGKDVHLYRDSVINTQTWTNEKPYLIINSVALDENQQLTVEKGTHIYSHRGSSIFILGSLRVNGTYEEPVIFEGDRLNGHSSVFFTDTTDNYDDVAGQWNGIYLSNLSKNNYINYAEIKNAVNGVIVDSVGDEAYNQLEIHNSKLEHHSHAGLFALNSSVFATNCLLSDCGYYAIALTRGGNYEFYHCTIGNYWSGAGEEPSVYINNYFVNKQIVYVYPLTKAYFGNTIIWGNTATELNVEHYDVGEPINYMFENCILKIDPESILNTSDINHFKNNSINTDPLFNDYYNFDFTLKENSPAINTADFQISNLYPEFLNYDINLNNRFIGNSPDIGCYEF
jgi:hypothetical protein